MTTLESLVSRLAGRTVAVAGDVMLDRFVIGSVDRISPEAPVPIVRFAREECRLGGAANVMHNVVALGGTGRLIGLVGDDASAAQLRRHLETSGLDASGLVEDASRPTTQKTRIVTLRNQQVARVDQEDECDVAGDALAALCRAIDDAAAASDALVLSDYRKGVVTAEVIACAAAAAARHHLPLLVDPKTPIAERYRGATLVTPNHHEAELMTRTRIRTAADARTAARDLHDRTGANVLITRGEHGMWILECRAGATVEEELPAVAREVADVTGAGDTVIAVLALAIGAGATLGDAARLANVAAGLVVARFGPATVSRDDLIGALAG